MKYLLFFLKKFFTPVVVKFVVLGLLGRVAVLLDGPQHLYPSIDTLYPSSNKPIYHNRWVDDDGDAGRALDGSVRGPHMFKSWFDIEDAWGSTLSNAHNQVRVAEYQRCQFPP